jgi:catechol 2,3-dioxygenase-like lactoylglutathione lyase family enzyme
MSAAKAIFNQINIIAGDIDASMAFYRRLGLDMPDDRAWPTATGIHHASAGETEKAPAPVFDLDSVAFARKWNSGWRDRGDIKGRVVIGVKVASRQTVDDIYADLTGAGYKGLQPPWDAFWGARFAIVEDPDGIAVGIMSPKSDDKRAQPPQI